MTEIEAKEWLEYIVYVEAPKTQRAMLLGIKALEKQIAKKPELIEGKMWTCPCCDNNLMHKWLKYPTELMPLSEGLPYCLSCGQKIDWGNEDAE